MHDTIDALVCTVLLFLLCIVSDSVTALVMVELFWVVLGVVWMAVNHKACGSHWVLMCILCGKNKILVSFEKHYLSTMHTCHQVCKCLYITEKLAKFDGLMSLYNVGLHWSGIDSKS